MNYFTGIENINELKKRYHELAKKYHTDINPAADPAIMKQVNVQYEKLFNELKQQHNASEHKKATENAGYTEYNINETAAEFIDIINKLLKIARLANITIELCGRWIWISGDTKTVKDDLKSCGCYYASKKIMWYWHAAEDSCKGNRRNKSMNEIRTKYGSNIIKERANIAPELTA